MHNAVYAFHSPLASADDFQKRIPTIHSDVCAPKMYWLVANPLALIMSITISGLAYGTLVLGVNGMVQAMAQAPHLEGGVETIFGLTRTFAYVVRGAWYFSIIAHGIEAFIAVQH
jgi:hypothetical protein